MGKNSTCTHACACMCVCLCVSACDFPSPWTGNSPPFFYLQWERRRVSRQRTHLSLPLTLSTRNFSDLLPFKPPSLRSTYWQWQSQLCYMCPPLPKQPLNFTVLHIDLHELFKAVVFKKFLGHPGVLEGVPEKKILVSHTFCNKTPKSKIIVSFQMGVLGQNLINLGYVV